MVTKALALLIGVIPLLINGNDRLLNCLKNHRPGVKPFNSTHIKVGWTKGDGSGFEDCVVDPQQLIDFERYEIILDGGSLGKQVSVKGEYSAVIAADPCLKHDVAIKLKVSDGDGGHEAWKTTETAHYNDVDELDSLFSNLLKEGIKLLCKVSETIKFRSLPDDVREKCIKNVKKDKDSVFLEMIDPSDKQEKGKTLCVKGKSDQPELHQCVTNSLLRKSEVDQTLEIVSNDYCLGEGNAGTGADNNNSTKDASSVGVFIALCVIVSTIVLGAVAATTFCLWKRRQKSQTKEKEVVDEDENPVYGLYQVWCKFLENTLKV